MAKVVFWTCISNVYLHATLRGRIARVTPRTRTGRGEEKTNIISLTRQPSCLLGELVLSFDGLLITTDKSVLQVNDYRCITPAAEGRSLYNLGSVVLWC